VRKNWKLLEHCSAELRADWELVLMAARQLYKALQFASDTLLGDRVFMLEVVKMNWRALEYAPDKLRADRELILSGVKADDNAIELASRELREERRFMLDATRQNHEVLAHLPDGGTLRADEEFWIGCIRELPAPAGWTLTLETYGPPSLRGVKRVMEAAVKRDWRSLELASEELRGDPDLVAEAIRQDWRAAELATVVRLEAMSEAVRQDWRAIIRFLREQYDEAQLLKLVQINPSVIQAQALRGNKLAVIVSVRTQGECLQYASTDLQADKEVVQAAVDQTWKALQYASMALRADRKLVLGTFKQDGLALQHVAEELRADRSVVVDAMKRDERAFQFATDSLHQDTSFWETLVRRFPHGSWKKWLRKGMRHPIKGGS